MERQLLEPIVVYDRLNVLSAENCCYEVLLRAKDLKQLSRERREELLTQRVWFQNDATNEKDEADERSELNLILEMSEDFFRHS